MPRFSFLLLLLSATGCSAPRLAPGPAPVRIVPIVEGWARSSVNAAVFRTNSVVTHGDTQYAGFYDPEGRMTLAKRSLGSTRWEIRPTQYTGNVRDAHNAISLAVDGSGVLHVSWDQHGQALRYARGVQPGSLELTGPLGMTGRAENAVTYPQFYLLPDGDLAFLYRDGSSGRGNVMLNRYDVATRAWQVVQHPLIDGQGERNAYVNQLAVDRKGGWHLSWSWRETPDVATNHDILYAYSSDEGRSWKQSSGGVYTLPITASTAEVAWPVPQGSELINQTSMTTDSAGHPLIATYWRPAGTDVPQYQLVWHDGRGWRRSQISQRTQEFRLSGGGTKRIPISRPQIVAGNGNDVYVVFRDEERGGGVSVAHASDAARTVWHVRDLHPGPVGLWEPTYDPTLWQRTQHLHLFLQVVGQGDAETLEDLPPQTVSILEWVPVVPPSSISSPARGEEGTSAVSPSPLRGGTKGGGQRLNW